MRWSREREIQDQESGESDVSRTMELIRELSDKLIPGLKFTKDLPELHASGRCLMLDIQVWLEKRKGYSVIRHSFYQKEITSPLVFHAQGAHSWRSKLITLAEEMRRRYLHMDQDHTWEEQYPIMKDFLQKMADSGYSHQTREEVIKSATTK